MQIANYNRDTDTETCVTGTHTHRHAHACTLMPAQLSHPLKATNNNPEFVQRAPLISCNPCQTDCSSVQQHGEEGRGREAELERERARVREKEIDRGKA